MKPSMKLHREGDRSKALCQDCGDFVTTTLRRRDVPFNDGSGIVRNLLVHVCDSCDRVVGMPAQSTPAVAEALKQQAKPIEAQLPAVCVDALDLAARSITSSATTDFRKLIVTYFLHRAAQDPRGGEKLLAAHRKAAIEFPEQRGAPRRRLSMKVSPQIDAELRALMAATTLSVTETLKSLVFEIHADVLLKPRPALMKALRDLAAVAG